MSLFLLFWYLTFVILKHSENNTLKRKIKKDCQTFDRNLRKYILGIFKIWFDSSYQIRLFCKAFLDMLIFPFLHVAETIVLCDIFRLSFIGE